MTTRKRRKYIRKKEKKNKSSFKTFLIIAAIIIVAFFVWQIVITISQKEKKESALLIKEKPEEEKEKIPPEVTKGGVESAINYALGRLEIPKKFIKTYTRGNDIIKEIIIDNNQLSFPIANIFITDKVEEAGGQVITVKESSDGNSIEMKIFDPKIKKYIILKIQNDQNNLYQKIWRQSSPRNRLIIIPFLSIF